jgi:hypothetical protein
MAVGLPLKTTYANGDVYSASDVNDTNGTVNLFTSSTLSSQAGKNAVINGGSDIAQRGTSISGSSTLIYTLDRWCAASNNALTTLTVSQQATSDTTNLPNIRYCTRVKRSNTGINSIFLGQSIETANAVQFAGKTITLSFYARKGSDFSASGSALTVDFKSGTGTDQNGLSTYTGSVGLISQNATLTTTWQRFSYSVAVPSTATEVAMAFYYAATGVTITNDYFEITGVQLELGSTATTFSRAGGTIQGELAACQRYYYRTSASGANYIFGLAQCYGTTTGGAVIPLPVPMRISPTALEQSGTANHYKAYSSSGAALALTSVPTFAAVVTSQFQAAVNFTVGSGLTGGNVTQFTAANSSAFLGWSAEL